MLQILPDGRNVRSRGELDRRFRHAIDRLVRDEAFDDDFVLEDVAHLPGYNRQFEDWTGDISGRYIGALALAHTYTGEDHSRLHRVARGAIRYQRDNGIIGSDMAASETEFRVMWGQTRILLGLTEYCSVFAAPDVLAAVSRLASYFVQSIPYWSAPAIRRHTHFPFYTQVTEGLIALYNLTREPALLETARQIADLVPPTIEAEPGVLEELVAPSDVPVPGFVGASHTGRHSHGFMSSLIGLLDVYDQAPDVALLERVRADVATIAEKMLYVDGMPPEYFPWSSRDEGCSVADWLNLNLHLGRITRDASYFAMAERTWRNALYANQAQNGGFCHHHFRPDGYGYTGDGNEAWWCCSFHGPRAYLSILRHLYTWDETGVQVQFFEPSNAAIPFAGGTVRLIQETSYPAAGGVAITVVEAPVGGVALSVRVPPFVAVSAVRVNRSAVGTSITNGYLTIEKPLRAGDRLEIDFPLHLRLEPGEGRDATIWYGPLLMTTEIPGGTSNGVVIPPPDAIGAIRLPPAETPAYAYAVPGAHFKIVGIGNVVDREVVSLALNRPQPGRLRPFSEQTSFVVAPPAIVRQPVILATTDLLRREMDHYLKGV